MSISLTERNLTVKEVIFQVLLHSIVFAFYAFDRRIPGIVPHYIFFFSSYIIAGIFVNYVILPKYFYSGKYLSFGLGVLIAVCFIIIMEEAVWEQIFYPETRGKRFLGVFFNLLSTLPTLTILVGFKFAWDALVKQQENKELRNSVKESELQFLKSQINPHFLFNNLNNLYAFAIEKSEKTPELILELSAVLRYMLYDCKAKYVPLKNEIEQLENYINLSRLQIEGRGKVTFKVDYTASNYVIAPLILTVFIENAFKHSASSQTSNIHIDVSLSVNDNGMLRFICHNTFSEETNTQSLSKGIGLKNVQKRLDLLYPNSHTLSLSNREQWFEVFLNIDLTRK